MGRSKRALPLVHSAAPFGYPREVRPIYQAGGPGMRIRLRVGAGSTAASHGTGTEASSGNHSPWNQNQAEAPSEAAEQMSTGPIQKIGIIDSHTGGEPTRIVITGGPELGGGSAAEQAKVFKAKHDAFRSAVVNEPRGSDVIVGALLVTPADKSCVTGVIFFNNVGVLGMCGHGTIGLIVTLAHLGRIQPGEHRVDKPVRGGAGAL